jgi:hypothetical protein
VSGAPLNLAAFLAAGRARTLAAQDTLRDEARRTVCSLMLSALAEEQGRLAARLAEHDAMAAALLELVKAAQAGVCGAQPIGYKLGEPGDPPQGRPVYHPSVDALRAALAAFGGAA